MLALACSTYLVSTVLPKTVQEATGVGQPERHHFKVLSSSLLGNNNVSLYVSTSHTKAAVTRVFFNHNMVNCLVYFHVPKLALR